MHASLGEASFSDVRLTGIRLTGIRLVLAGTSIWPIKLCFSFRPDAINCTLLLTDMALTSLCDLFISYTLHDCLLKFLFTGIAINRSMRFSCRCWFITANIPVYIFSSVPFSFITNNTPHSLYRVSVFVSDFLSPMYWMSTNPNNMFFPCSRPYPAFALIEKAQSRDHRPRQRIFVSSMWIRWDSLQSLTFF